MTQSNLIFVFIYFSPFLVKDDALQKHVEKVLKNKKLVGVLAIKFGG